MNHPFSNPYAMLVSRVGQSGMMVPGAPPGYPCGLPSYSPQTPAFYQQAAAAAAAAGSPQISLGINSEESGVGTIIAAGTSRTLTASPTVPLCITRLVVDRGSAPFFQIVSIKAARTDYGADGQSTPADGYTADACCVPMQMPMLLPGTNVTLVVKNKDSADHHFYGNFLGIPGPGCGPCI
jgi:hypothetical protein